MYLAFRPVDRMARSLAARKHGSLAHWGGYFRLAGKWDDPRSTEDIVAEVVASRTSGREVTF